MLLFDSVQLGALKLANRIVMAPMTRCRADDQRVPTSIMREYYTQRASAGLILTEGVAISPSAVGYANTPGIWTQEQIAAWQEITASVHAAGGKIMMQLWHVGRISHPMFLQGELPVAPSAIKPAGEVSLVRPKTAYETPRALSTAEVKQIIADYKQAAINAKKAGFDGVELHAANGYLPDQFLQSGTNQRTDEYGGNLEKRARFILQVVDELIAVWGSSRVGIHLSPRSDVADVYDENPKAMYRYLLEQLNPKQLAFVFFREYRASDSLLEELRAIYHGNIIANESLNKQSAEQLLQENLADAVAFGNLYIANANLVERLQTNRTLNAVVKETIYAQGATGYTDYP